MNYVIAEVKTRRKDYTNMDPKTGDPQAIAAVNGRMLTIEQYHSLARRVIGKWAPEYARASMLNSEDAIDYVAHKIMMGDWDYNKDRSKIKTYRGYCGQRAIQSYLKKLAEQRSFLTNYMDSEEESDVDLGSYTYTPDPKMLTAQDQFISEEQRAEDRDRLKTLMMELNDTQRECLIMHYVDDMRVTDIARILNMTREGVRNSISEAEKQMRFAARAQDRKRKHDE